MQDCTPHIHLHYEGDSRLYKELDSLRMSVSELKGLIMSNQADLVVSLNEVTAKVAKIGEETKALIAKGEELMAAVVAAGELTPETEAALAALKAQADVVDALVPDAA